VSTRPRLALAALLVASTARAQQPGVDVQAYHFRIDLPDTGNAIRGWASVFFDTQRGYDDTLRLDLVGMTVDRVVGMRTLRGVPFSHDGRMLKIATRGLRGAPLGVMVEYHGRPSDGLIYNAGNARGRRSFFADNWPNRARYWLPTVDHPSDKARVLWSVRAPRGWRVVTNAPQCRPEAGVLQAGTGGRGRSCLESAPIPTYTMVLGATPMTVSRHRAALSGSDSIPIEVWAYPEDSAFADSVPFRRATEIVETLSRMVGPFPYAKLAHVQSSTRYGGMENATAIFYAERSYVRRTMGEGVVRHETAHQWFGDAVTEADWHHLWLSEGFATYFDLVVGAALDGDSVLARGLRSNAESYIQSNVVNRPIIDTAVTDPNEMLNDNSYQKGGWVLHMLRRTVGDSAFFGGLRDYYRSYRDSSVLSAQLERKVEAAAGTDLGWFFRQWLRQPGYPRLDARVESDSAARRATLRVRQVQPAAWGAFRIDRLPVSLEGAGCVGVRGEIALAPVRGDQSFMLPVAAGCVPSGVRVDPDGDWLVRQT
jgi:aminopeptidase N